MAGEWRKARIEELADRVAMGPFGSSIKVETFVHSGVPVISGQHLHGSKVDDRVGFNFVAEQHADRLKNANVRRGDVIFTPVRVKVVVASFMQPRAAYRGCANGSRRPNRAPGSRSPQ